MYMKYTKKGVVLENLSSISDHLELLSLPIADLHRSRILFGAWIGQCAMRSDTRVVKFMEVQHFHSFLRCIMRECGIYASGCNGCLFR